MTKTVPQESFFNFFKTIEMPDEKDLKKESKEENEDEEPEKDVGELMDEDFDLGNEFKDQLIPLALEYYLEVIEEDEEDDEDGGCDDEGCDDKHHHGGKKDQDSDEDEDKPAKGGSKKKKGGKAPEAGAAAGGPVRKVPADGCHARRPEWRVAGHLRCGAAGGCRRPGTWCAPRMLSRARGSPRRCFSAGWRSD